MKPRSLFSDQTLFRDPSVFEPQYLPDAMLYRDQELQTLARCASPALRSGRPISVLIQGNTATGKTTSIQATFQQLSDYSKKVIPVSVNCLVSSSSYKVLSEIHKKMFGYAPPDTGVPKTRVYEKVFQQLAKDRKALIVALDDVHALFVNHTADEIFSSLLRASELFPGVRMSIWATTHIPILHLLDSRNRSLFQPEQISFRPYSQDQMYAILSARAEIGLAPDVASPRILKFIAGCAPDVRHALEMLRQGVLRAEFENVLQVTEQHIPSIQLTPTLEPVEQLVFEHTTSQPQEAGVLYEQCLKQQKISYSTFYRIIQKLKGLQLLDVEQIGKQQGRTSLIRRRS